MKRYCQRVWFWWRENQHESDVVARPSSSIEMQHWLLSIRIVNHLTNKIQTVNNRYKQKQKQTNKMKDRLRVWNLQEIDVGFKRATTVKKFFATNGGCWGKNVGLKNYNKSLDIQFDFCVTWQRKTFSKTMDIWREISNRVLKNRVRIVSLNLYVTNATWPFIIYSIFFKIV